MNNLNSQFQANPLHFLETHILHPNPSWAYDGGIQDQRDLVTGIQTFDILPPTSDTANLFRLKFWERGAIYQHQERFSGETKTKTTTPASVPTFWSTTKSVFKGEWKPTDERKSNEAPIRAYWIPFRMNRTYEMQIGFEADYCFTAGLSGCTVVVSGDPQRPRVAHINRAGDPIMKAMIQKYNPQYTDATKAETTQRQIMLQELKSVVDARKAGMGAPGKIPTLRGNNFDKVEVNPWAVNARGAIEVGGPRAQGTGSLYFGVCDFEQHYSGAGEFDCLAQVTGLRNPQTGNWRFYFQRLSHGANSRHNFYFVRGSLQCVVCKTPPAGCACPA